MFLDDLQGGLVNIIEAQGNAERQALVVRHLLADFPLQNVLGLDDLVDLLGRQCSPSIRDVSWCVSLPHVRP